MTCTVQDRTMAEKEMQKQMGGCMAGFLHLFDRHQLLSGKRVYASKRLHHASPSIDSASGSVASMESPPATPLKEVGSLVKVVEGKDVVKKVVAPLPLPLPAFEEGLRSSWKLREAPRLSLDSRVGGKVRIVYANAPDPARHSEVVDKRQRAPGVVARLMGLDALPQCSSGEGVKKAELRRSASESRVSRFTFDGNCLPSPAVPAVVPENLKAGADELRLDIVKAKTKEAALAASWRSPQQRRSFFDAQDVFPPEPVKRVAGTSLLGEIEKRLRMKGIEDNASDLETLKQILEALQLKGLLHSAVAATEKRRNLVYDGQHPRRSEESPIVVMKPARSPRNVAVRRGYECSPPSSPSKCRSSVTNRRVEAVSPPPARANRTSGRGCGIDSNAKSPRRMNINVETQRKRATSPKRAGSDSPAASPSSRNWKTVLERMRTAADDESSTTMSESNISTYSQFETERSLMEDYKEGRNLLERCDKLLHCIAEITANDQPSPVSVLDASFYKDEESPPPLAMKKCLQFQFNETLLDAEDELWSPAISPIWSNSEKQSGDSDFVYVAEVLRAMDHLQPPNLIHNTSRSEIFTFLERRLSSRLDSSSKASTLHRRLLFDTVAEIVNRQRNPNSWTVFSVPLAKPAMQHRVWAELEHIRRQVPADDICELICAVLSKDMVAGGPGSWGDRSDEMSEAVLDIERLIFKDLVGEAIGDFSVLHPNWDAATPPAALRRKLAF